MSHLRVLSLAGKQRCAKDVDLKTLINKLNFHHFTKNHILLCFRHQTFGKMETVAATPLPLTSNVLQCQWPEKGFPINFASYEFLKFLVPDGRDVYSVVPRIIQITEDGVTFSLPETCQKIETRNARRFDPQGQVEALIVQNGTSFSGRLLDFNAEAFRIHVVETRNRLLKWLNPEDEVVLFLGRGDDNYYSGGCRILRHQFDHQSGSLVLTRMGEGGRKFRPRTYRNARVALNPEPTVTYRHPLTGRKISLRVADLSITGLALQDPHNEGGLFPGLSLHQMQVTFAGVFHVPCQGQVIYRTEATTMEDERPALRFGVAITDISKTAQDQLLSVIQQANDPNCFVSNQVDPEALWDFFFRTGFIYPEKYLSLQNASGDFIGTYEKIYSNELPFSRHFFYQKDGKIAAHMGMLKFYPAAWMVHHHASDKSVSNRGGMVVLEQVSQALAESFNTSPGKRNFVVSYFRPENKFPDRIFGGFYRSVKDPTACSLDACDYVHMHIEGPGQLPDGWDVGDAQTADFMELEAFYGFASGGLAFQALGFSEGLRCRDAELSQQYREHGLERTRVFKVLKMSGRLKAFFLLSRSDPGLNLSDLTNCIQVFFLDTWGITKDILNLSISRFSDFFADPRVPLLGFPEKSLEKVGLRPEKTYNLWVLDVDHSDRYLEFCHRFFRIARRSQKANLLSEEAL